MSGRRSFTRRRRSGQRGLTTNHFTGTVTNVATATETATTILTGIDAVTNRGSHVPDSAWVKYVSVTVTCTTIPAAITRFQACLFLERGGDTISNPITSWFTTTDPISEGMLEARQGIRSRVVDVTKAASDFTVFRAKLVCKRGFKMRDGDDLKLSLLQNSGGNLDFNYTVKALYRAS